MSWAACSAFAVSPCGCRRPQATSPPGLALLFGRCRFELLDPDVDIATKQRNLPEADTGHRRLRLSLGNCIEEFRGLPDVAVGEIGFAGKHHRAAIKSDPGVDQRLDRVQRARCLVSRKVATNQQNPGAAVLRRQCHRTLEWTLGLGVTLFLVLDRASQHSVGTWSGARLSTCCVSSRALT